jgi:DNA-binding NtrC family response regulator
MAKPAVVVVADRKNGYECCSLLAGLNYAAEQLVTLSELERYLKGKPESAVILDLDTVTPDRQFFRELKKKYPRLHILGISKLPYHPNLEEVIGAYFYACLVKPLDVEELAFWLRSITENQAGPTRKEKK